MVHRATLVQIWYKLAMTDGARAILALPKRPEWECALPGYLQHDLDAFKKGLETEDSLIDCLWGELYGSINGAEIDDQAISHEQAEYLRDTYLRRSFR